MPGWTKPNRLYEVQRRTAATDDEGGQLSSWETFRTVWGRAFPLRAEERVQAQRVTGFRTHEIHIRYDPEITHAHRLKAGPEVYDIDGVVDVDGRRRYAKAMAVEVVG